MRLVLYGRRQLPGDSLRAGPVHQHRDEALVGAARGVPGRDVTEDAGSTLFCSAGLEVNEAGIRVPMFARRERLKVFEATM